jgi:hypothetical protein
MLYCAISSQDEYTHTHTHKTTAIEPLVAFNKSIICQLGFPIRCTIAFRDSLTVGLRARSDPGAVPASRPKSPGRLRASAPIRGPWVGRTTFRVAPISFIFGPDPANPAHTTLPMPLTDVNRVNINPVLEPSLVVLNLDIVAAHLALPHQPVRCKRPVLEPVCPPPLAGLVVPFVPKLHRDLAEDAMSIKFWYANVNSSWA